MADPHAWTCQTCGNVGLVDGADGFFYCLRCGSQAEDIIDTGVADEDFADKAGDGGGALYLASHRRQRNPSAAATATAIKAEPISQSDHLLHSAPATQSQFWSSLTLGDEEKTPANRAKVKTEAEEDASGDGVGPTGPEDFGWIGKAVPSFEDYHNEVRIRYVMGLQLMVELQCEALVRDFKVSPLICGLAGIVWSRFVASTRVFGDGWIDEAINESESQHQGEPPADFKPRHKYGAEPHNMYGQRAVIIWLRSLKKTIPLSYTLVVSFLACHLAREAVLATDIESWSIEGKLPYISAFVEIEKRIGKPTRACPISSCFMFRPVQSVTAQKLESLAASIAESIGLTLPPVNFYAIASCYLRKLCLPLDKILPHALRIYEWSMPPDLWLSSNELRFPTYVGVMSILIVAIRICYNIHGFGEWEKSLSRRHVSSSASKWTEESEAKPGLGTEEYTRNNTLSPQDVDNSGANPVRNMSTTQKPDGEWERSLLRRHVSSSASKWTEESEAKTDLGTEEYAKDNSVSPQDVDDSSTNPVRNTSATQKRELDTAELLCNLEARYNEMEENCGYAKDFPTFLRFCKDIIYAGSEPSFEDHDLDKLIELMANPIQNEKDSKTAGQEDVSRSRGGKQKRAKTNEGFTSFSPMENKFRDKECPNDPPSVDRTRSSSDRWSESNDQSENSSENDETSEQKCQASADTLSDETTKTLKYETIRRLKLDMELNRFCYIPPRVNAKRFGYLHYVRKRDEGALTYVAHADYYILLRACAKVAQIETRLMHMGVLAFERRLAWFEHRINHCLHVTPPSFSCEFCSVGNASVESIGLSNINI